MLKVEKGNYKATYEINNRLGEMHSFLSVYNDDTLVYYVMDAKKDEPFTKEELADFLDSYITKLEPLLKNE